MLLCAGVAAAVVSKSGSTTAKPIAYEIWELLKFGPNKAFLRYGVAEEIEDEVSTIANCLLSGKRHLKILDAGCGSATHIKLESNTCLVGIDVSRDELERNVSLSERIIGDIQDCQLPAEQYDAVVCWMVLEHLSRPQNALKNLLRSTRIGGLLILAFPNLFSIKGIVTKLTPLWFHRLFYKRIMQYDFRPFPTYLRLEMRHKQVVRWFQSNGAVVKFEKLLEGRVSRQFRARHKVIGLLFCVLDLSVRCMSFGRLTPLSDSCILILQRNAV